MSKIKIYILIDDVQVSLQTVSCPDDVEAVIKGFRNYNDKYYTYFIWENGSTYVRIDASNCRSYCVVWQSCGLQSLWLTAIEGQEIVQRTINLDHITNFLNKSIDHQNHVNSGELGPRTFDSTEYVTNTIHHDKIVNSIIESKPFNGTRITNKFDIHASDEKVIKYNITEDIRAFYHYRNEYTFDENISEDIETSLIDDFFSVITEARYPLYDIPKAAVGGGFSYRNSKLSENKTYKATIAIMYEGAEFNINMTNICRNLGCICAEACSCVIKKRYVVDKAFCNYANEMLIRLENNPELFENEYIAFKDKYGHVFINNRVIGIKGSITIDISSEHEIDYRLHRGKLSANVELLSAGHSLDLESNRSSQNTRINFTSSGTWKSIGGSPMSGSINPRDIFKSIDSNHWVTIKAKEYVPTFDLLPDEIKHGIYKHYYKNLYRERHFLTFQWSNGDVYDNSDMSQPNPHIVQKVYSNGSYSGEMHDNIFCGFGKLTFNDDNCIYIGMWSDYKMHGHGCKTFASGDSYTGEWRDDKYHGTGSYSDSEGNSYIGEWRYNKMHGKGTMSHANNDTYTGDWRDDTMHGTGTMSYANGDSYTGEWRDGNMHGTGTYSFADGSKYTGQWRDDSMHGTGTYLFANGSSYTGEWSEAKKHGLGTFSDSDGNTYTGEWMDNRRHGKGTVSYANGDSYTGQWKDDKANGKGTVTFVSGNSYTGEWSDGKMHGRGCKTFSNGDSYTGEWKDGKMHGFGCKSFALGSSYTGEWRYSKRHGHGCKTFANGDTYTGQWKDDKAHGTGTYLYANGSSYNGEWRDGKRHGHGTETFANGLSFSGDWKDGRRNEYGVKTLSKSYFPGETGRTVSQTPHMFTVNHNFAGGAMIAC